MEACQRGEGNAGQGTELWSPTTDSIFCYTKGDEYTLNPQFKVYTEEYLSTLAAEEKPVTRLMIPTSLALVVVLLVVPGHLTAQSSTPCITNPDSTVDTRAFAIDAVTNFSATDQAIFSLPHQAAPDVSVVTSDSVCALARDAYNLSRGAHLTRVVVVRVGTDRFVVAPGRRGKLIRIIFDTLWQKKAGAIEF